MAASATEWKMANLPEVIGLGLLRGANGATATVSLTTTRLSTLASSYDWSSRGAEPHWGRTVRHYCGTDLGDVISSS